MMTFLEALHQAVGGTSLDAAQAEDAMITILNGDASTAQIAAFLVALRMKGETAEELLGFARGMRSRMLRVDAGAGQFVDTCGTGGDGSGTFNISTSAAFVVAGAGVRVAKHGNRSISSKCGSADIFEGLGVRLDLTAEQIGDCIREVGIGFLFAPALHPAMKNAQAARLELKMRTAFNLLGPLANPAGAPAQIVGAPSLSAATLMAGALAKLGLGSGYVVHGRDGMDEITTITETDGFEIRDGKATAITLSPEQFGVSRAKKEDLAGGDRGVNLAITNAILNGEKGPRRDIVLVNAAAALVAVGSAKDFAEGMEKAAASIDSGAAREKADLLARYTVAR
jgi:anthranilate phosphoribosyltransferase